ncbi:pantoate--beta-alanine ligase [Nesterenkonia lutea]|uniref:Pantothenate synthetase n=1 Tax=Nesterenkonia lutea TaxID=272919 RepID=A0ABR9JGI2_9MICC|nr:pantoate--beta-alanine ligase [Nesterenkonia lutea]MBE1525051.1 pantoate--beta-alanine ligase [Nesterenkonia lutea]
MTQPIVLTTAAAFRAALADAVADHLRTHGAHRTHGPSGDRAPVIGLVPTMGALHPGHAALIDAARRHSDIVVASIFVNPLQFDDDADYLHYPRTPERDVALLAEHGADLIFAPEIEEMYPGYPESPRVSVSAGELGRRWEGAARPGHFDGVVTVVAKLLNIMAAPAPAALHAWFGAKDAEQVAIITRMVADLNLPVTIRTVPIVRDANGLALSSRNRRLQEQDYAAALALPAALSDLVEEAASGRPLSLADQVAELTSAEGLELDYLVVLDPASLQEIAPGGPLQDEQGVLRGEALALIAARVGPVRLIDNAVLRPASTAEMSSAAPPE